MLASALSFYAAISHEVCQGAYIHTSWEARDSKEVIFQMSLRIQHLCEGVTQSPIQVLRVKFRIYLRKQINPSRSLRWYNDIIWATYLGGNDLECNYSALPESQWQK